MEHFKALVVVISVNSVGLSYAATLRNDVGSSSPTQQRLGALVKDDAHQPQRLESEFETNQELSLLSIMRKLQRRPIAAVAYDVKKQRAEVEQSMRERQLLTDMGHLEDQLETWKSSQFMMQSQMSAESSEIATLKAEHLQAIRDEQEAAAIWRYVKMLMALITLLGLLLCVYIARNRALTKANSPCLIDTRQDSWPAPVVECEPKAEFPTTLQKPFEDTFQATMSLPHPTLAENPDIEAPNAPQQAEDVWKGDLSIISPQSLPKHPERQESEEKAKCEYFSLAEDVPVGSHIASQEEDWWNESAAGY